MSRCTCPGAGSDALSTAAAAAAGAGKWVLASRVLVSAAGGNVAELPPAARPQPATYGTCEGEASRSRPRPHLRGPEWRAMGSSLAVRAAVAPAERKC